MATPYNVTYTSSEPTVVNGTGKQKMQIIHYKNDVFIRCSDMCGKGYRPSRLFSLYEDMVLTRDKTWCCRDKVRMFDNQLIATESNPAVMFMKIKRICTSGFIHFCKTITPSPLDADCVQLIQSYGFTTDDVFVTANDQDTLVLYDFPKKSKKKLDKLFSGIAHNRMKRRKYAPDKFNMFVSFTPEQLMGVKRVVCIDVVKFKRSIFKCGWVSSNTMDTIATLPYALPPINTATPINNGREMDSPSLISM
eukprot:256095_1